jgi:hypothetical protein
LVLDESASANEIFGGVIGQLGAGLASKLQRRPKVHSINDLNPLIPLPPSFKLQAAPQWLPGCAPSDIWLGQLDYDHLASNGVALSPSALTSEARVYSWYASSISLDKQTRDS